MGVRTPMLIWLILWKKYGHRHTIHGHIFTDIHVMEWWSVGQDTGSGVSKNGDHSRRTATIGFYCYSSRQFSAHPKSSLARIDKRTARAARNTRYHYNQIGPLDHKMADKCVSLARTNTVFSTITKLIKSWKTSNKSYSYNLLNTGLKLYYTWLSA